MLGVVINENFHMDGNIKLSMAKNDNESQNFSCLSLFMLPVYTHNFQRLVVRNLSLIGEPEDNL